MVLDCAHNVASAQALAQALEISFPLSIHKRTARWLIFAGNQDKDLAGMLTWLAPRFDHICLTSFHNPRCVPTEQLATRMPADQRAKVMLNASAVAAWQEVRQKAAPDDLICITGSVFLAGELRPRIVSPS